MSMLSEPVLKIHKAECSILIRLHDDRIEICIHDNELNAIKSQYLCPVYEACSDEIIHHYELKK
jgi:hypothetical protein